MPRIAAIAAAVVLTAGLGLSLALVLLKRPADDQFAQCRTSSVAGGEGGIGGPFTLVDGSGATVTDTDVITDPSLLYFGYTFCPDVCPLDVVRNAEAVEILEERGAEVTPVFISIDPKRDTPEVVGEYADAMHERMIGLTGSAEQVRAASQAYRTYFKSHDDGEDPYYLVDHSTFTYLVFPEVGFVEFFRRDLGPEEMADRVGCFVDAAGLG